jgi:hypothetical protein
MKQKNSSQNRQHNRKPRELPLSQLPLTSPRVQDLRTAVSEGEDESDINASSQADFPGRSVQASSAEEGEIVVLDKAHLRDGLFADPKDGFGPCVVNRLHVDNNVIADDFLSNNLRLHGSGFPDFRDAVLDQTESTALGILGDPLLVLRVVVANVENVLVISSASQRPPQAPRSPKAVGSELEPCVSVLVAGYGIAEVFVVAAECNGGVGL